MVKRRNRAIRNKTLFKCYFVPELVFSLHAEKLFPCEERPRRKCRDIKPAIYRTYPSLQVLVFHIERPCWSRQMLSISILALVPYPQTPHPSYLFFQHVVFQIPDAWANDLDQFRLNPRICFFCGTFCGHFGPVPNLPHVQTHSPSSTYNVGKCRHTLRSSRTPL